MTKQVRLAAFSLVGAMGLSLLAPMEAEAGKTGRRNTAIALGAVAAYGVIKKKPAIAGLAGAGAIYSFVRSQQSDRKRKRRRRGRRARYYPVQHVHHHYDGCGHRGYDRGYRSYSRGHRSYGPPGWSRGRKVGWGGGHVPPGHAKKWGKHKH
jgi:hypothetical protein